MKIIQIETIRNSQYSNLLWVMVQTEDGQTGLGETFRNPAAVETYIHETCAPYLLGRDAGRINDHADNLINWNPNRYLGFPSRSVEVRGNSAVDIALWDLKGKTAGMSLTDLFGGPCRDEIAVYNTCAGPGYNMYADRKARIVSQGGESLGSKEIPDDLAAQINDPGALAESLLAEGITAMKIWPFDEAASETRGQRISSAQIMAAAGKVEAIRKAVGGRMDILLEYHSLWKLEPALRIARALEDYDVFWNEDPIDMAQIGALAEYRARTNVPVAGSEAMGTSVWYRDALAAGAVDYMHYDLAWVGGITEALRISGLAHAHGKQICPHDCTGPVAWTANLHICLAFPQAMILESVRAYYNGFYRDLVTALPKILNGKAQPMQGPGLGTELHPALLNNPDTTRRSSQIG